MAFDDIEPVLSRTSARLSFLMPHSTSELADSEIVLCPSSLENTVLTVALAVSFSVKLPWAGWLNCEVTWTS